MDILALFYHNYDVNCHKKSFYLPCYEDILYRSQLSRPRRRTQ